MSGFTLRNFAAKFIAGALLAGNGQLALADGTAEPGAIPSHSPPVNRVAQANEAPATSKLDKPPSLTWHGITLYGTVDIGIAYLTHGAPVSQSYAGSLPFFIQR